MSTTSPGTPPAAPAAQQPSFWQHHSPRGECPLSFSASALLHLAAAAVILLLLLGVLTTTSGGKPVQMDVVEVEGLGGGLGGLAVGPGLNDTGNPGKAEGVVRGKGEKRAAEKINDFNLEKIPPQYLKKEGAVEG